MSLLNIDKKRDISHKPHISIGKGIYYSPIFLIISLFDILNIN